MPASLILPIATATTAVGFAWYYGFIKPYGSFTTVDIPSLKGRTILITGANTGLGKISALELARAGAKIYMASRTKYKAV